MAPPRPAGWSTLGCLLGLLMRGVRVRGLGKGRDGMWSRHNRKLPGPPLPGSPLVYPGAQEREESGPEPETRRPCAGPSRALRGAAGSGPCFISDAEFQEAETYRLPEPTSGLRRESV